MSNDSLHESAVKLLLDRARLPKEDAARGVVKSYNLRRKEATAALRPILTNIFACLTKGESVGGYTSKEDWSAAQSITIRQIQRIVAGPKPQAKRPQSTDVALTLTAGMTVTIDGLKITLTEGQITFLKDEATTIAKQKADAKKFAGPTRAETRAVNKELRAKKAKKVACKLCNYKKCQCAEIQTRLKDYAFYHPDEACAKLCTKCNLELPAALLAAKPFATLCRDCKVAYDGDVPTYKGQQVTEGKSLYSVQVLPLGFEPQNGSLLRGK
jgi:hypothetical protein